MGKVRLGAWAGVLSGIGLALEVALFMASGWSPQAFSTLDGAVAVMRDGGHLLRLAVVVGVANLVLLTFLFIGLAEHVERTSPALAGAVLYLGVIGNAIHALVPIGLYQSVPIFLGEVDGSSAASVWLAFKLILDVAQSTGILFMGLAMLAVGCAAFVDRSLSRGLGVAALLAGAVSVAASFAPGTPLVALAGGLAMASIVLSIVFRVWSGLALWRTAD